MNKRITIKDLAKISGVSPSTVSRALSNHPDLNKGTKEKIVKLAEQYNYLPNSIAQSLKNAKTKTVGLIVPEIKHNFFSSVISGAEKIAYENGYTIMVCQSEEDYKREVSNLNALISNRVDGILISISEKTTEYSHLSQVNKNGIPLVCFDRTPSSDDFYKVIVDDEHGGYLATRHLIENNYKNVAFLGGPENLSITQARRRGYIKALNEFDIEVNDNCCAFIGFNEGDGKKGLDILLEKTPKPDAIFAINDPVAFGIYERAKELGLRIPEDIAVVGFSDNPISSFLQPPLSTISQPGYEMGEKSMKILLDLMKDEDIPIQKKSILDIKLIKRDSTKSE